MTGNEIKLKKSVKMKSCKFRRKRYIIIFLFNLFFISIIYVSSYHHHYRLKRLQEIQRNKTLQKQTASFVSSQQQLLNGKDKEEVVVLFWTKYFGYDPRKDPFWISVNKTYPKCFEKCRVVLDKDYFGISDAVVFHSRDIKKSEMPLIHPSNQIWVYLQQESPIYTREDLSEYNNVFNWTMTYRPDSDIYHPYFLTISLNSSLSSSKFLKKSSKKNLQRKTKLVAWIVSNCNTPAKRENYVDQLEEFIKIDTFGGCGSFPCQRSSDGGGGCLSEIALEYKFYLSFENSLCTDYITEKFGNALQYDLVPIVYGEGDYEKVAPPGSFINTKDFKSPKALADYLLLLDKNPKLYLKYFEWKRKYKVVVGDGLCSFCRKVRSQRVKPEIKIYENLTRWWHGGDDKTFCRETDPRLQDKWTLLGFNFKWIKHFKNQLF